MPKDICDRNSEIRIFQKGFNYSQDGRGNRLVLHLQGCNLRCPWCSNPEGLSLQGGKSYRLEEIVAEIERSRPMFFDGGGITLSGGEATLQFEVVSRLLKQVKANGVNTAIETNGTHRRMTELFPLLDYLMIDCKHYDEAALKAATGAGINQTADNIRAAIACGPAPDVRIPLIGSFNASWDDAYGFAELLVSLGMRERGTVEILPYHEYGRMKYDRLGMEYAMNQSAFVSIEKVNFFRNVLLEAGLKVTKT